MSEEYGRRLFSERADRAHSALEAMYAGTLEGGDLEEAFATISDYIKAADHIVDVTAVIPEGYVIVPVEPTHEMEASGITTFMKVHSKPTPFILDQVYKAMIKAAQKEGNGKA